MFVEKVWSRTKFLLLALIQVGTFIHRVRIYIKSIVSGFEVSKKVLGFFYTTSALVFTLAFAFSIYGIALSLRIASVASNYTLEFDKTEKLEGEVEKYEDVLEETENTQSKTPYEESSNTHDIDEIADTDGYECDISVQEENDVASSSTGSEESAESEESDRPNPPNNTPENSENGSVEESQDRGY